MQRDARGLELSTDSPEAAALFSRAAEHFVKAHADTMSLVNGALAADPGFAMAHCFKGYLLAGGANAAARPAIAASLAAAEAGAATATPRERRHIAALAAGQRGALNEAMAIWDALLDDDPLDLLAVRIGNVAHFRHGHTAAILDQVTRLAPAWSPDIPGYPSFRTVWAFAHEEVGDTREAEAAIDDAHARDPENFFTHHVKAHVLNAGGRWREGSDWLVAQTGCWHKGANLTHHLWWHRALMLLDLGEHEAVLASYDNDIRNLNGPLTKAAPAQFNDLQNAGALLWRLEQQGMDAGGRWEELAAKAEARIGDPAQPLLPPHLMLALAATGRDTAAARLLESLRAQAAEPGWETETLTEAVIPACEAVLAHRRGQHARVVDLLASRQPQSRLLGGSAAQRDLFRQILIDSAFRAECHDVVRAMLAEETASHPAPPEQRAGYGAAARWLVRTSAVTPG